MQKLIGNFCESKRQDNGLLLIDMPTGMGKTYAVTKYIAENYEKIEGKIFFITQLKKNLPEDDLRKRFEEIGKSDAFDKMFIRVENNVDNLCENFDAVKDKLRDYIKDKQLISKIEREVRLINHKDKIPEDDWLLVQQAKDDLTDISEKKLRDLVVKYLRYDSNGKERKRSEVKRLIEEDDDYKWIGQVYPTVYSADKKIFLMSLDKFLLRFATIVDPSFYLFENDFYMHNGVIFIDEFDTTKEVILKRIIQNGLDNRVGIINIFRVICSGLFDTDFTNILTEQSRSYSGSNYKPITKIIENFKDRAKNIIVKHNLNYLHKLKDEYRDDVSFLFQDYKIHTIVNGEYKDIIINTDKDQKVNWMCVEQQKKDDNRQSIYQLIGDTSYFLKYFQRGIGYIADNYKALKEEKKKDCYNITIESAIRTTLAEFGVYGTMQNYLTYNIMISKRHKSDKYYINDALDSSVYEKGFKYYHILDNDNYDTQSRVNYVAFHDSPEKFLIRLIERTKVVGVSASANLPTVLANYDLDYIKKVRGKLVYKLSELDEKRLREEFNKSIEHHNRAKIHCEPVDGSEDKLTDKEKNVYQIVYQGVKEHFKNNLYLLNRFSCFANVVAEFFKEGEIKSLLYFANTKGHEFDYNSDEDKKNFLIDYFEGVRDAYESNAEIYFLNGNNDVFERRKENVFQSLKRGKKVFVMTTYGSMGAGQNIHYEFDSELETNMVRTNELSHNSKKKDFDAIYLEKPSHVMVNTTKGFESEDDFIKYIFQVKFLQEVGDFNQYVAESRIRDAFKIISGSGGRGAAHPRDSSHFNMAYAKIALQAIGRICRTGNKRSNIYIFYQKSFDERIKPILSYFQGKPLNPEFHAFLSACSRFEKDLRVLQSEQILENKATNIMVQSNDLINNTIGNWTLSNIEFWEKVRESVLKQPTAADLNDVAYPSLYIELPQENDHYYVKKRNKSSKSIRFHNGDGWERVDEKYVMLDKVLLIPGMKKFFEDRNYATSFAKGKYILVENVLKRIYQGALGEVVGREILNTKILKLLKVEFEKLSIKEYEKFDDKIKDIYFDFKLWSGKYDPLYKASIESIEKKMQKCHAHKVVYVSILKPSYMQKPILESLEYPVWVLPYLYDIDNKCWNKEGMVQILGILDIDKEKTPQ